MLTITYQPGRFASREEGSTSVPLHYFLHPSTTQARSPVHRALLSEEQGVCTFAVIGCYDVQRSGATARRAGGVLSQPARRIPPGIDIDVGAHLVPAAGKPSKPMGVYEVRRRQRRQLPLAELRSRRETHEI